MKVINRLMLFTAIAHAIILVPVEHAIGIMLLFYIAGPFELISNLINPPSFINGYYQSQLVAGLIGLIGMICFLRGFILREQGNKLTFILFGSAILSISYAVLVLNPFADYYGWDAFYGGIPFAILAIILVVRTTKFRKEGQNMTSQFQICEASTCEVKE